MIVHYSGPVDRVEIPLPNGRTVSVAKGHDIDLSEHLSASEAKALGASLIKQEGVWSEANKPAPAPRSSAKKED